MIRNSTAKQLSSVISEQGIFSTNDFSRAGYIDELLRFQKFAGEFVFEDERARINEVCSLWDKSLYWREEVLHHHNCIALVYNESAWELLNRHLTAYAPDS